MKPAVSLHLDGRPVATVLELRYETPWATATVEFFDLQFFAKLCAITAFRHFDMALEESGLSEQEQEQQWNEELAAKGLSPSDLSYDKNGKWLVQQENNTLREMYSVTFEAPNTVVWRF